MNINEELKMFAAGNTDFYDAAISYFCDKKQSAENKALMQEAFMAEIARKSGVAQTENGWIAHPSVQWASFAVIDAAINAILPQVILPQFSMFADFRTQGYGDVTHFTVQPNSMYTISVGNFVF